jgi:hypothetical protein
MMIARRIALTVLLILAAGWFAADESSAAQQFYTCRVLLAGPGGAVTLVKLTDTASTPAFTGKWFLAPADRAKEILAVALTAMTNGMTVRVSIDLSVPDEYPPIYAFYLKP